MIAKPKGIIDRAVKTFYAQNQNNFKFKK